MEKEKSTDIISGGIEDMADVKRRQFEDLGSGILGIIMEQGGGA